MSDTNVELSDIITPLKKIVRRPSSPSSKSKASSPTLNAEPQPQISASTSTLNDKGTEKTEEKQRHSILGLFSRKHQPPSSLENLPLKASSKTKSDSATTPSGSLSFLQRLSFHSKQSPTTPHTTSFPSASGGSNTLRPNELLLPVKELDSTITDEATSGTRSSSGDLVASPVPDEQWFEAPVTEADFRPPALKTSRLSTTHAEYVEAESVRDATIRELEEFLVEFRNGKLRTLKDEDLAAMRRMHTEQSAISTFQMQIHNQLMEYGGDIADTMDFDEQYQKLGEKLDHLHTLMENFGGLSNTKSPMFE